MKTFQFLLSISFGLIICSCSKNPSLVSVENAAIIPVEISTTKYKTQNVVIVVIDGPRYSETWGDSIHQYIPHLSNDLSHTGVISTEFYTNGQTYTNPGHVAITTGVYQNINNNGYEFPENPSIFQYWLKKSNKPKTAAWVIASKPKLEILGDCINPIWSGANTPHTSCGINGRFSGYRADSATLIETFNVMTEHKPNLILINFREPDYSGHLNNWNNYLQGIIDTDEYVYQINNFIKNDPNYSGSTTIFLTNDHGRHIDGLSGGFVNHGDNCNGCRHLNFYASGPDFKSDTIFSVSRNLVDIPATIAELLELNMPSGSGKVMTELFK